METASNDSTLLAMAQQRVQSLLEDYVNNIAEITGKKYTIKWIYLDDDNPAAVEVPPEATSIAALPRRAGRLFVCPKRRLSAN